MNLFETERVFLLQGLCVRKKGADLSGPHEIEVSRYLFSFLQT